MKMKKKLMATTVCIAGVCLALFVLPEFKKENSPSHDTEIEAQKNTETTIDINESSLEAIMGEAIDSSIEKAAEEIILEENYSTNLNNETDRLGGFYDALKSIDSQIDEQDTNYRMGYVQEVLTGESFVVQLDGQEKVVKLIGIKEGSGNYELLNELFRDDNSIYLEFDIKRYSGDDALCYAWLAAPDKNHLDNMLNYLMLSNNVGTLDRDTSPNIKYSNALSKAYSSRK